MKGKDLKTLYTEHVEACQIIKAFDEASEMRGNERLTTMRVVREQAAKAIDTQISRAPFNEFSQAVQTRWEGSAIALSQALQSISKKELKTDCIYRGGLLRNLQMADEAGDLQEGMRIENLAFRLNPKTFFNCVDFTGLSNQKVALDFALEGFIEDSRTREDAIVIEAPFNLVKSLMRIREASSKINVLPDLFREYRLRIFKPVDTSI